MDFRLGGHVRNQGKELCGLLRLAVPSLLQLPLRGVFGCLVVLLRHALAQAFATFSDLESSAVLRNVPGLYTVGTLALWRCHWLLHVLHPCFPCGFTDLGLFI